MGCCTTAETVQDLEFHQHNPTNNDTLTHKHPSALTLNTLTEHTFTDQYHSEDSSHSRVKATDHQKMTLANAETLEDEEQEVGLSQTWPSFQTRPIEEQPQWSKSEKLSHRQPLSSLSFSWPPRQEQPRRAINFAENAYLRIRYGPLVTINEEESQLADTQRMSEYGSRPELRTFRSNFQE